MKSLLLIQLVLSILLAIAAIGMMIGSFIIESPVLWKAFTIVVVTVSILFVGQFYKELIHEEHEH
jgi:hypothetical protein